jgi:hypothetical protein
VWEIDFAIARNIEKTTEPVNAPRFASAQPSMSVAL